MDMDIKTDMQCKSLVIVLAIVLKKPCLMKKFLHFHAVYEEFFIACGFTNSKSQIPIFQNILDQSEKSSFFYNSRDVIDPKNSWFAIENS